MVGQQRLQKVGVGKRVQDERGVFPHQQRYPAQIVHQFFVFLSGHGGIHTGGSHSLQVRPQRFPGRCKPQNRLLLHRGVQRCQLFCQPLLRLGALLLKVRLGGHDRFHAVVLQFGHHIGELAYGFGADNFITGCLVVTHQTH